MGDGVLDRLELRRPSGTQRHPGDVPAARLRGERELDGAIRTNRPLEHEYRIEGREDRFELVDGVWWRRNEIWRVDLGDGTERLLWRNQARTMYVPEQP